MYAAVSSCRDSVRKNPSLVVAVGMSQSKVDNVGPHKFSPAYVRDGGQRFAVAFVRRTRSSRRQVNVLLPTILGATWRRDPNGSHGDWLGSEDIATLLEDATVNKGMVRARSV